MDFNQYGHGGGVMQKGYGLGGIFGSLAKAIAPKLNQGLLTVGKRALKTGLETISDIAEGGDFKSSLKRRATENINDLFTNAIKKATPNENVIQKKAVAKRRRLKK